MTTLYDTTTETLLATGATETATGSRLAMRGMIWFAFTAYRETMQGDVKPATMQTNIRAALTAAGRGKGECSTKAGQAPKPDCGTICCIGGAAYLMSKATPHQLFPDEQDYPHDWDTIQEGALEFLGLPNNHCFIAHDLFDHTLAPDGCTPAQAAAAVQNVMEGKAPWN